MHEKIKKGFTIIELVLVMSIILIITATSVVSYHRITANYKQKEYDRIINGFEAAAEAYAQGNTSVKDQIYSGSGYATVTLKVLKQEGLIDDNVEDPVTGSAFDEKNYVSVYLDENRNFHAVYMKETGSAFTNSRPKQSILAGSLYGRVQMLEYIIGYTKGEYDEATGSYGTKEIDYSLIEIKITDITGGESKEIEGNIIPTSKEYIDHTFRLDYSFDFKDDGVKKVTREVVVYNIAPTLKSVTLSHDTPGIYINQDVIITVQAESVHGDLTYHYVVDGVDKASKEPTFNVKENASVVVYVEDIYGWKSESVTRKVETIDKTPPEFELKVIPSLRVTAGIQVLNAKDSQSGLAVKSMKFENGAWEYITDKVVKRNGTYKVTIRDVAGNEATKTVEVTNITMMNFIGQAPTDAELYAGYWGIKTARLGSTNKYATISAQSISEGTPIADGMVLKITLTAPKQSVTLKVTNGSITGSDATKSLDKGDSVEYKVVPSSGYQTSGASVACSQGADGKISGDTVTVSNVLANVDCTVTMKKIPVSYSYSGGGGGGYYSCSGSCGMCCCSDSCIIAKMSANSDAWFDYMDNPQKQNQLHQQNVQLATQLSSASGATYNSSNGTWNNSNTGGRLYVSPRQSGGSSSSSTTSSSSGRLYSTRYARIY